MDELIQRVADRAGITPEQARIAVSAVLRALASRLPSPIIGQIRSLLDETDPTLARGPWPRGVRRRTVVR
jgi:uncharacterized protein (DUF2267 family)